MPRLLKELHMAALRNCMRAFSAWREGVSGVSLSLCHVSNAL